MLYLTHFPVSESGWMTIKILTVWFHLFQQQVTEKPMLLVFVRQLMGISIVVIEKATREGVHIPKLLALTTDKLQYLHITCLSPLKGYWEKSLNHFVSSFRASKTMLRACLLVCFERYDIKDIIKICL